jgi:hypothetical protein
MILAGFLTASAAMAAGRITHLSGVVYAKKATGILKVLSEKSVVEQGDMLVSGNATYARIQFTDNSEISMGPDSQISIERFSFAEAYPENDQAAFRLIKGKVRSVSGLLGKRSPDRAELRTPQGTISIGGAIVIVEYIPPAKATIADRAVYPSAILAAVDPALIDYRWGLVMSDAQGGLVSAQDFAPLQLAQNLPGSPPTPGVRSPGLYVQVLDGMIHLTNGGGSQSFSAGQFGFTPSFKQPPVVLPANPGMQFTPPPSFSSASKPSSASNSSGKSNNVDCEVR